MSNTKYNGIIIHFNRVYDYDTAGTESNSVLMSHPMYYMQNGYNTLPKFGIDDMASTDAKYIRAAKALLLLHSIPFNYDSKRAKSFFNDKDSTNVGYEVMPYGLLALMGGLLYRKRVYEQSNVDIINTYNVYKAPTVDETFLVKGKQGIRFGVISKSCNSKKYEPLTTVINDNIDIYIKNKLIALFISFVEQISSELNKLELKLKVETTNANGIPTVEYTHMTYTTFSKFVSILCGKVKTLSSINKIMVGKQEIGVVPRKLSYIYGFQKKYCFAYVQNSKLYTVYREDDEQLQLLMDKLYNHKCGVLTTVKQSGLQDTLSINKSSFKNVINGFANTLDTLLKTHAADYDKKEITDITTAKNDSVSDLKLSIYEYLKQFWDKWLCAYYNLPDTDSRKPEIFSVDWFKKHFLFIDTKYNDVSSRLKLNCSTLLKYYEGSYSSNGNVGESVNTHLAKIANAHGCNYFCYPDFIDFAKKDDNNNSIESPESILGDLFKPIPYNEINPVEADNQFVVMLTTEGQTINSQTQFRNDGFDIWYNQNSTSIVPSTFSHVDNNNYELRMGYKVPSFGVAFSRQHNSIFTSIDIGMDTQQLTEQAIKSLCYISQLGNSNKRAVTFYGNDIYNVYTAYSYIVTITMLGDMQIQPLMYFQLMNVPMFRGTYMIIEVKHSIQSGNCTTTFRGVKMSNVEAPLNKSWFTIETETSADNNSASTVKC